MTRHLWCVIHNPAAGRHRARKRLARWQRVLEPHADFWPTQAPGHARILAAEAARAGYEMVIAAGGDGTAHEVLNGLVEVGRRETRLGLLPVGSANDLAYSLLAAGEGRGDRWEMDVGVVETISDGRRVYLGCCAGIGFNARVTTESRRLPWLQGLALYGVATLRAWWSHFRPVDLELAIDGAVPEHKSTLLLSILNGRREGNFPMAPAADPSDGWLDWIHAGPMSRWEVLRLLPGLAAHGPPEQHPAVHRGVGRSFEIRAEEPLICHVDGELFCLPEHRVRALRIHILPRALTVDLSLARSPTPEVAPLPRSSSIQ